MLIMLKSYLRQMCLMFSLSSKKEKKNKKEKTTTQIDCQNDIFRVDNFMKLNPSGAFAESANNFFVLS